MDAVVAARDLSICEVTDEADGPDGRGRRGTTGHLMILGDAITDDDLRRSGLEDSSGIRVSRVRLRYWRGLDGVPGPGRLRYAVAPDVMAAVEAHGQPSLVLVDHQPDTHAVAEFVVQSLGAPYVLLYRGELPLHNSAWPLVNGAVARLLDGPSPAAWQRGLIFEAEELTAPLGARLAAIHEAVTDRAAPQVAADGSPAIRLALVSYYTAPCESVGVNRVEYWRRELENLAGARGVRLSVEVFTASHGLPRSPGLITVPDLGRHGISRRDARLGDEADAIAGALEHIGLDAVSATWVPYLDRALASGEPHDVVLFTGNPFYCFGAARHAKARGSAVILDFRDPMANNPRLTRNPAQVSLLKGLLESYLRHADAVTSVNDTCLDLICGPDRSPIRRVISNGYDEASARARPTGRVRRGAELVLAGRLYAGHDPEALLEAVTATGQRFTHVGPPDPRVAETTLPGVRSIGRLSPADLGPVIAAADLGVIFTNGAGFEHTTKVFDYIGADLDILIVTDGTPRTGELHTLTEHLGNVHWVRNERGALKDFLARYTPSDSPRASRREYSRAGQTDKLIDLILELR